MSASIESAAAQVRSFDRRVPRLALVLGSGLGAVGDDVEDAVVVSGQDIPGYPTSTVIGHHGRLILGTFEQCPVVVVQGRAHAYEGHRRSDVTFAIRLVHAIGATHVMLTNAAGGIRPDLVPGSLMWIRDHINWVDRDPGGGPLPSLNAAGPDSPYDLDWRRKASAIATNLDIPTAEGVYVWTLGPSFETPAEIRAFASIGADAVGMSTVPEATEAARLGMRVLGLSTITNAAAGLNAEPLNHEEVLETGRHVRDDLTRLVRAIALDLASSAG